MKNVKAGLFLIISQFVYVIFTVLWFIFLIMTLLMLDQWDTLNVIQTISLVLVWCFPIAFIGSGIASWVLYHKRKFKVAVWIGMIPLLWVLPLIGFFA
ncbi:hypothetical protein I6N90_21415 [Paenibacillus sp. GSMTC-2017]|uniref:hypothetical protein n=1 Tax=Paenibacillus sp. GSMTC-2017 TaxID=2794350 RepID=UPI0018D8620F|nr:hypothetical protein [Paenibacillus sp. GSMTC-2017]MBH5320355.1 hypothetical protein [Paenibacillus sp. GSMTC-2017]